MRMLIAVAGLSVLSLSTPSAAPAGDAIVGYISDNKCAMASFVVVLPALPVTPIT